MGLRNCYCKPEDYKEYSKLNNLNIQIINKDKINFDISFKDSTEKITNFDFAESNKINRFKIRYKKRILIHTEGMSNNVHIFSYYLGDLVFSLASLKINEIFRVIKVKFLDDQKSNAFVICLENKQNSKLSILIVKIFKSKYAARIDLGFKSKEDQKATLEKRKSTENLKEYRGKEKIDNQSEYYSQGSIISEKYLNKNHNVKNNKFLDEEELEKKSFKKTDNLNMNLNSNQFNSNVNTNYTSAYNQNTREKEKKENNKLYKNMLNKGSETNLFKLEKTLKTKEILILEEIINSSFDSDGDYDRLDNLDRCHDTLFDLYENDKFIVKNRESQNNDDSNVSENQNDYDLFFTKVEKKNVSEKFHDIIMTKYGIYNIDLLILIDDGNYFASKIEIKENFIFVLVNINNFNMIKTYFIEKNLKNYRFINSIQLDTYDPIVDNLFIVSPVNFFMIQGLNIVIMDKNKEIFKLNFYDFFRKGCEIYNEIENIEKNYIYIPNRNYNVFGDEMNYRMVNYNKNNNNVMNNKDDLKEKSFFGNLFSLGRKENQKNDEINEIFNLNIQGENIYQFEILKFTNIYYKTSSLKDNELILHKLIEMGTDLHPSEKNEKIKINLEMDESENENEIKIKRDYQINEKIPRESKFNSYVEVSDIANKAEIKSESKIEIDNVEKKLVSKTIFNEIEKNQVDAQCGFLNIKKILKNQNNTIQLYISGLCYINNKGNYQNCQFISSLKIPYFINFDEEKPPKNKRFGDYYSKDAAFGSAEPSDKKILNYVIENSNKLRILEKDYPSISNIGLGPFINGPLLTGHINGIVTIWDLIDLSIKMRITINDINIPVNHIISELNDVTFFSTNNYLVCFNIINKKKEMFYYENGEEGLQKIIKRID